MTKKSFLLTGLIALCMIASSANAQQAEEQSTDANYNSRTMYMHLTYGIGGGDWSTQGMGLGVAAKVLPNLYTGVSAYYFGDMGGRAKIQQMIPATLDVQYEFGETRRGNGAMLVGTSVGYNFVLNKLKQPDPNKGEVEFKNGLYLNPSIGYRLNFSKNSGVIFDLGYQLVQGKEVEHETQLSISNHLQHNVLFKASVFF